MTTQACQKVIFECVGNLDMRIIFQKSVLFQMWHTKTYGTARGSTRQRFVIAKNLDYFLPKFVLDTLRYNSTMLLDTTDELPE